VRMQTPYDEWLEAPYYDEPEEEREELGPDRLREEREEMRREDR
jgi:hypothetical protein